MPRYDTLDYRAHTSEPDPVLAAQIRLKNNGCSCNWRIALVVVVTLLLLLSVAGALVYLFVFAGGAESVSPSNQTITSLPAEPPTIQETAHVPEVNTTIQPTIQETAHATEVNTTIQPIIPAIEVTETITIQPAIQETTYVAVTNTTQAAILVTETNTTQPAILVKTVNTETNTTQPKILVTTVTNETIATATEAPKPNKTIQATTPSSPPIQKPVINVGQGLYSTCDEYLQNGFTQSGVYRLQKAGHYDFQAHCTMDTTNQKAWMTLQKRTSDVVPFWNQTFEDYSQGFGNVEHDHWLGLRKVRQLIEAGNHLQLRVEIEGDHCEKEQDDFYYVGTWNFEIESEQNNFTLRISDMLEGNFTDPIASISNSNSLQFYATRGGEINKLNCLERHHMGGWWAPKDGCTFTALNGEYTCEKPNAIYGLWVHYKRPINLAKTAFTTSYIRPRTTRMLIHVSK